MCVCQTWIKGVPASFRSAIALNWNRQPYMSRTGCYNWVSSTSVSRTSVSRTGCHNWVSRTSVSRTNVPRTVCVYVSRWTRIDTLADECERITNLKTIRFSETAVSCGNCTQAIGKALLVHTCHKTAWGYTPAFEDAYSPYVMNWVSRTSMSRTEWHDLRACMHSVELQYHSHKKKKAWK